MQQDVLGKNPTTTVGVIDELETDNWGIDGEPHDPQKTGAMSLWAEWVAV
jgi:phenylpyruvate tautomerase PptA (4-oxalocrotonate tautomerase family)